MHPHDWARDVMSEKLYKKIKELNERKEKRIIFGFILDGVAQTVNAKVKPRIGSKNV